MENMPEKILFSRAELGEKGGRLKTGANSGVASIKFIGLVEL